MSDEDEQGSYDTSDPKQVNKARKKSARSALERKEVVQAIMSQPQGRAFLYEYLSKCGVFTTPFMRGEPDTTSFNAGMQAVGHWLMADIMKASPENYWKMVQEAEKNERA